MRKSPLECDQACHTFLGPWGLEDDLRLPCRTVSSGIQAVALQGHTIFAGFYFKADGGYLRKSEIR